MTMEPSKYDDLCELVAERAGINSNNGGGVVVIIVNGNKGDGISCKSDLETMQLLPDILLSLIVQIRTDVTILGPTDEGPSPPRE